MNSVRTASFCIAVMSLGDSARAATYQVGPGRPYATLQEVVSFLAPGDVVEVDGETHTLPMGTIDTARLVPETA